MSQIAFALRGAALGALLPLASMLAQSGGRESASSAASPANGAPDIQSLLGMALTVSGNERDTLGLLVAVVTPGGPADRAGVEEGSRLAELNGVALRVAPASAGQRSAGDVVQRRLARTLAGVQSGDEVSLQTYRGGHHRRLTLVAGGSAAAARNVSYAAPVPAAPPARQAAAPTVTLASVLGAMGELESQLHELSLAGDPGALGDSLIQAEQELGDLRLRLRAAEARQRRRPSHAVADEATPTRAAEISGLKLGAVDQELASYYGDGSEQGVLVLEADDTWAPIRAGDVLLAVNGARADGRRLAEAVESQRPVRIELLRRRKPLSIVMQPRD